MTDVFALDLSVLAYQVYNQSLLWPLDPYYEEWARPGSSRRDNLMALTHEFAVGKSQLRGPGSTRGWPTNTQLDPILTDYRLVRPWVGCVTRYGSCHRYMSAYRPMMQAVSKVSVSEYKNHDGRPKDPTFSFQRNNPQASAAATDRLYTFEGATGSFDGRPSAWSLMGVILERHEPKAGTYEVHISYRGSQSGDAYRAAYHGFVLEAGNPDWVTDMEIFKRVRDTRFSPQGSVVLGFRDAVADSLGSIVHCLEDIAARNGHPPVAVHVTGHSLGGGLATQLASALAIGSFRRELSEALQAWPWASLQLTTFGAPKAGNQEFADHFDANVNARRVWAEGDPIVEFPFNAHVGIPLALRTGISGTLNHEPSVIRRSLIDQLLWEQPNSDDGRLTHESWRTFDSLGQALYAASNGGDELGDLFLAAVGPHAEALTALAASVVQRRSSYRVPFTKFEPELRRRARQARGALAHQATSLDELRKHLRRFTGIQPGSEIEDHLRRVHVVSQAIGQKWSIADLLDDPAIARTLRTYRHPRAAPGQTLISVSEAAGPQPSSSDRARVKWIMRMRKLHRAKVHDGSQVSYRKRVPPVSGLPHLVPACSFYEGLEWLPQELFVPTKLPPEAQLLNGYKAWYYGVGKIGFAAYARSPISPEVPWRPEYEWNESFAPQDDGWADPTSDDTFVRLRTQGPNPFMLEKVGDGFELNFGQLFDGIFPPICARFDLVDGHLVSRNISVGSYTHSPGDPTWENAKRVVNAADIRCIPFSRHLLDVHFIVGSAFALAAYSLPTWHPLRPFMHFFSFGTLQVNDYAYKAFFVPTSYFIGSGFMTGDCAHKLFANRVASFSLDEWVPSRDIAARGIDAIAGHPYVEDSLSAWTEITAVVEQYLDALHYDTEAIAADSHLQAWHLTLTNLIPNADPRATPLDRSRLVELCSIFLYNNVIHEICGDLSPILASADPDDKAIINLDKLLETIGDGRLDRPLPAPSMADVFLMDQATIASQFNVGGNNMMTVNAPRYIDDPKLTIAVQDLQRRLRQLEAEFAARNDNRDVRFGRMLPSMWEASISF